jgi:hypothetical protein
MQLSTMPMRLCFRTDGTAPALDARTGDMPRAWRGTDLSIALATYFAGAPLDLSNLASLKLEIRSSRSPAPEALLIEKTVAAAQIYPALTNDEWLAGTQQHCTVALTAGETNLAIDGGSERSLWLVLSGLTSGGASLTYGFTHLTLVEDATGDGGASAPPAGPEYYNKTETVDLIAVNSPHGIVRKIDFSSPVCARTGPGSISVLAGTRIAVAGRIIDIAAQTAIEVPAHTVGTDYAIYATTDGRLIASANWTAPTGYTTANSLKIGGYHYGPGGCAAGQAGGDSTPQIHPRSLWDLKFRPASPDPRGMAFESAANGWGDLYMLGSGHLVNGTSKYGVTIADGSSLPKRHTSFGGDGTATYEGCDWWACSEIAAGHGKTLMSIEQFSAFAYGTTEGASLGADPGVTGLSPAFTSRCGLYQISGVMWQWSSQLSIEGGTPAWAWSGTTRGRGQIYAPSANSPKAILLGGYWVDGANCGSRSSDWLNVPWNSGSSIGARCRSDHLQHA